MKCNNCNNIIPNDSVFCEHCGGTLSARKSKPTAAKNKHSKVKNNSHTNNSAFTKSDNPSWRQEPMTSVYVAGKLENELRHIHDDINSNKVATGRMRIALAILIEILTYFLFFSIVAALGFLIFKFEIEDLKKVIEELTAQSFNNITIILHVFAISAGCLFLGFSLSSTFARKQSINIYKQTKITKKIVSHIDEIIDDLKKL